MKPDTPTAMKADRAAAIETANFWVDMAKDKKLDSFNLAAAFIEVVAELETQSRRIAEWEATGIEKDSQIGHLQQRLEGKSAEIKLINYQHEGNLVEERLLANQRTVAAVEAVVDEQKKQLVAERKAREPEILDPSGRVAAIAAAQVAPDTVLVPREPTEAMRSAFYKSQILNGVGFTDTGFAENYAAMLAAYEENK